MLIDPALVNLRPGGPEWLQRMCVEFVVELRHAGLPVGPDQTVAFWRALHAVGPISVQAIYFAGRAVLATERRLYPGYDAAFISFFGVKGVEPDELDNDPRPPTVQDRESSATPPPGGQIAEGDVPDDPDEAKIVASDLQLLRQKSFAKMTPAERREAATVIRRMRLKLPHRRSRRRERAHTGPSLDIRRTLRRSLETDGEPLRLARRKRRTRERPLTLLVDVSGSMTVYAQALLRFGHAAMHAGHRVEVFTMGVRLTRVTEALAARSADRALAVVGKQVSDWDGGTRLASSFAQLVSRYGGHSSLRGAVVVVCSDGLDRDDPALLAAAMRRVHRLAHRTIWLNPLKSDPRYQPLARGMAAALPSIDVFLAGHNIASLEATAEVITAC